MAFFDDPSKPQKLRDLKEQNIFYKCSLKKMTRSGDVDVLTARIRDDKMLLKPILKFDEHIYQFPSSIQSSPYEEKEHWLDLSKEEMNYQIIALALQSFSPVTNKYAFEEYEKAFNISEIVRLVKTYSKELSYHFQRTTVYVIAFRSILFEEVRKSSEKRQVLADVDKASHLEANESGGLLKYWFGVPDDEFGKNLATCLWRSKGDAKLGGGGQAHRKGVQIVKNWYQHWQVEEYEFTIDDDVSGYKFGKI